MLSKHLSIDEYKCPCCGRMPDSVHSDSRYELLFGTFERIRELVGKPILISSGYRCPRYNREVGGVPYSVHIFGLALDLDFDPKEIHSMSDLIKYNFPFLRIGVYADGKSFVHIDVGYTINPRLEGEWIEGTTWSG